MRGLLMKPNEQSITNLYKTQSIAKMIEFEVPPKDRILNIKDEPEKLFPLTLGMLGDLCDELRMDKPDPENIKKAEENLRFCASFFDSYKNTQRIENADAYLLLVGAACYYLCNLPGSAQVLINKINVDSLDLGASGLEMLLFKLIINDLNNPIEVAENEYTFFIRNIEKSIKFFFKSGEQGDFAIKASKELSNYGRLRGSDRELFFSDIIYAVCCKKIKNSCWNNLPEFTGLSKEILSSVIRKKTFIKELWPSQLLLGTEGVFNGQSAVIQMPTSAGKTKSTEIIIRSAFLSERTDIAVVVAPFKALCHEIERDYFKAFYGERNISVDEINDVFENTDVNVFSDLKKKHIVILTPEKLYYLLTQQKDFAEKIGLIIFDEGHQFDSGDRGVTYELLLTELKHYLPSNCQRILISAVIHNAEQISTWLSSDSTVVKGNKTLPTERSIGFVEFIGQKGRINFIDYNSLQNTYFVPRVIEVHTLPKLKGERKIRNFPQKNDAKSIALALALKMSKKENVAIFCGQKDSVNTILDLANDIFKRTTNEYNPQGDSDEKEKLSTLINANLGDNCGIYLASRHGIFAHHADIPHGIKMATEYAMHKSLISFIVCTSTLAQGVNLPIKYLFISSTQQSEDIIKVRDFHNLIGRVGRAGKLTEGCIIFTNPKYQTDSYYWNQITVLLDPDKSEDCSSSLMDVFNPFENTGIKFKDFTKIVDLYYEVDADVVKVLEMVSKNPKFSNVDVPQLKRQLGEKFRYIEKVENFLMNLGENLSSSIAENLAKTTLAYQIANEKQKEEIEKLFVYITKKIEDKIQDKDNLSVYAKTLRGLSQTINLKDKLTAKSEALKSASSIEELFNIIWILFIEGNIQNNYFNYYCDKEKLRIATLMWIKGFSYIDIFKILKDQKINGRDYIKIESCVNIFENGVAYSGSVLINAITEIVKSFHNLEFEKTIEMLEFFQKQIKYGLPTIESILVYELGFCDRVIAQDIASIIQSAKDKGSAKQKILENEEKISLLLDKYPSYYSTVMNRIIL